MGRYVLGLEEIDSTCSGKVGGKGDSLGELTRIEDLNVPAGFCITTEAFRLVLGIASAGSPSLVDLIDHLPRSKTYDHEAVQRQSAEIRRMIEHIRIPEDLEEEITTSVAQLDNLGDRHAYAVRSSATAEDLPSASFAGQHDTYLNVFGSSSVLDHIRRCWASLFTDRAVSYRSKNSIDHRQAQMAVVVQQMVHADAAGIAFTADPVTSDRLVVSIEAGLGLGESLVSGHVNPDIYKVRGDQITAKVIASKQTSLADHQVIDLAKIARRIEAHFGYPQDIEWCLSSGEFQIVQSRPITTLFPIPETIDEENHLYVSVGHQQMMTDPMKPLGISFWQMTTPRPMSVAGGRLFVDVAPLLESSATRDSVLQALGRSDPLIGDALKTILARGDFIRMQPAVDKGENPRLPQGSNSSQVPSPPPLIETDPMVVDELIAHNQDSISRLKEEIIGKAGTQLLDFISEDLKELKQILFDPRSHQVFMSAMQSAFWLNEHLEGWLGERNVADTLTLSVPNNITSKMGIALLHVADVIRPHPKVVGFLRSLEKLDDVDTVDFFSELAKIEGGEQARAALRDFLDRFGMRCVGEIDITRTRWVERPIGLIPLILGNILNFQPGAGEQRSEQGREQATAKEEQLLSQLLALPDGERKAAEVKANIDRLRTFIGYREYPKYGMISRYYVYKQALLADARRLVDAGTLRDKHDIYFLSFEELRDLAVTQQVDELLIEGRKEKFRSYQALTPPRVFTSDGEVIEGSYGRDDAPTGALIGLAVSGGVVEGRARVMHDIDEADLGPGDILVTTYTDPSWSPLFVAISGLVTEVGGLMTHGTVIAREYGLPAVVGVEHATQIIREGQHIRVNGTDGYIEIID